MASKLPPFFSQKPNDHKKDEPKPSDQKPEPPEPKPSAPHELTDRELRAVELLKPGPDDFACLRCGFIARGGKSETHHSCDLTQVVLWTRKLTPPVAAGSPRALIGVRRNGDNFDVIFMPAVEVSGMKLLAQAESLDFALQKIVDVIPDQLPFDVEG